jgi:NAD-dependent SIR2 family protein deacetylase
MLVVGSSLMVYSGYRFAQAAADAGKPIAAVNLGRTRADALLALKVSQSCSEALATLAGPDLRPAIADLRLGFDVSN